MNRKLFNQFLNEEIICAFCNTYVYSSYNSENSYCDCASISFYERNFLSYASVSFTNEKINYDLEYSFQLDKTSIVIYYHDNEKSDRFEIKNYNPFFTKQDVLIKNITTHRLLM